MWIHQQKDWPKFYWDHEKLSQKLAEIRYQQGVLLGKMQSLGFALTQESTLETLTKDVVTSSAIEGEVFANSDVRSSVARHLGVDIGDTSPENKNVEGIVEVMIDATQNYTIPLDEERLFGWHAALFPTGRSGRTQITVGDWRKPGKGPMQVVSGPLGQEKIHFEAMDSESVKDEMSRFLLWFENENDMDLIIKAGITHLWFITIHPFDDGNGRIARAITDMALSRADGTRNRFYSLSTHIEKNKRTYYNTLESQQKGTVDITIWLSWFLDTLGQAISSSEDTLEHIIYKAKLWNKASQHSLNERQKLVLNRMLEIDFKGHINTSKYSKLAKCSSDTALRDLTILKEVGLLIQNSSGGRSTSYRLADLP